MHFDHEQRRLALDALNTPPPLSLFADPVEYIFADHFRQRTLCNILDHIAAADTPDRDLIDAALAFLKRDFGLHVEDEEKDLFPALTKRLRPEDDVAEVLSELSEEHSQDRIDAAEIGFLLEDCLGDEKQRRLSQASRNLLRRFSANERQHLTTENAIVLPIARARLKPSDVHEIGAHMASRRGIEIGEHTPC